MTVVPPVRMLGTFGSHLDSSSVACRLRAATTRAYIMQPMPVRIWSAFFFCSSLSAA